MDSTWAEIRKKAKKQTDNAFASKISSLTRLTDDEVKEITTTPIDKDRLATLLGIVCDVTKTNKEKAEAIKSINGLVEIAVPLLLKLL